MKCAGSDRFVGRSSSNQLDFSKRFYTSCLSFVIPFLNSTLAFILSTIFEDLYFCVCFFFVFSASREKERQIARIEEEKHRKRERELGKNYLLETYLNGLDEAENEPELPNATVQTFNGKSIYHFL